MPEGMSGYELAGRLRRDRPGLRVIFTSGYSPEVVAPGAQASEGTLFLAKPFDLEHLTATVRALLDQTWCGSRSVPALARGPQPPPVGSGTRGVDR